MTNWQSGSGFLLFGLICSVPLLENRKVNPADFSRTFDFHRLLTFTGSGMLKTMAKQPSLMNAFASFAKFLPSISIQKNSGFCICCDSPTTFLAVNPWHRDYYRCMKCLSIPRERALLLALQKHYPDWRNLSIHESSPGKVQITRRFESECSNYVQSQFFSDCEPGSRVGPFVCQNLEKQTFADNSFDLVITQDVLEHIFHPSDALKEIHRTLKPGGAHIFSVPVINRHRKSEVWATLSKDSKVVFTHSPEYHNSPVNENGCPVSMHWGFDIVEYIRANTGMDTIIEDEFDFQHGLSARYLEIFVSRKSV
jgi:hypothetical protein